MSAFLAMGAIAVLLVLSPVLPASAQNCLDEQNNPIECPQPKDPPSDEDDEGEKKKRQVPDAASTATPTTCPKITGTLSFSPASGSVGTEVFLSGPASLDDVTDVRLGTLSLLQSVKVFGDGSLSVRIPPGVPATVGILTASTPCGVFASLGGFKISDPSAADVPPQPAAGQQGKLEPISTTTTGLLLAGMVALAVLVIIARKAITDRLPGTRKASREPKFSLDTKISSQAMYYQGDVEVDDKFDYSTDREEVYPTASDTAADGDDSATDDASAAKADQDDPATRDAPAASDNASAPPVGGGLRTLVSAQAMFYEGDVEGDKEYDYARDLEEPEHKYTDPIEGLRAADPRAPSGHLGDLADKHATDAAPEGDDSATDDGSVVKPDEDD
jgi:hypothetical protein